jgi:tetratricopeptide (TPR) repeat protein
MKNTIVLVLILAVCPFISLAQKTSTPADSLGNDPKAYLTRSIYYQKSGQLKLAIADLNMAVTLSKNDPTYLIARAKFKDDHYFDDLGAVADCDLAIQQDPTNAEYYCQRARPYYDLEDFSAVLENCDKALELDPNHTQALILKANVLDMFEQVDEAKMLYRKAISIDPADYDGYKQLSITEYAHGNKIGAKSILEEYLNLGYVHPDIIERHGKILADLKDFKGAYADFSRLIQMDPSNPTNYYLRGLVNDSLNNQEAACIDMLEADKLGLDAAHQYLRKNCKSKLNAQLLQVEDLIDEAVALEALGNYAEAIEVYTKVLQLAPDSSSVYHARGIAKRRLENHLGAIEDYKKAIELDDNRVTYWVSMGVSYTYLDKLKEAEATYEQAIKVDPNYALSYYNLAGIMEQQKKMDRVIELLKMSIEADPSYTKAMVALGDCYVDLGKNADACEWYKRAESAGDNSVFGKRVRACN